MKAVLDHVGIAVGDLGEALAFYREALGIEVEATEEVPSQGVRAHFLRVGSASLELLESTSESGPIGRYLTRRGPGLHHLTLRVDDIHAALRAVAARGAGNLVIMARTDALAAEGLERAVQRCAAYAAAGADAIFFEAATGLDQYRRAADAAGVPILANMTEFGVSPLFTLNELGAHGVAMVLYPLTAFRAMSHAAQRAYRVLREQGGQHTVLGELQTRAELYRVLNYAAYEERMDQLLARQRDREERIE